jgi:CAAX protease family protein
MSGLLTAPRGRDARRAPTSVSPTVALLALVIGAIAVLLSERLVHGLEARSGGGEELTWWDAGLAIFEHALIVAVVLIPAWIVLGRIRASDLGLRPVPWRAATESAAVVYGAYLVVAAVLFAILGAPPERSNAQALAGADSTGALIAYGVIACVIAPPTEELLFRGFLFSAFRRRLAAIPAMVVAGGLFGLVHGPPLLTMLDLALLGIALCALYERTGSLLPCIGVHAVHNAIAFGAIISLSALATIGLTIAATLLAVTASWAFAARGRGVRTRARLRAL